MLFFLITVDKCERLMIESLLTQCDSRKEVIQPHLPIRLPCYDFTPVMNPTVVSALLRRLGYLLLVKPTPMV